MTATSPESGGVLIVDKPDGMTSHDVVARLRRVLGTRKVGHAGTLDPMATGVLVVASGRGTRLLPYLQATRKTYTATIRLGFATTTDDRTGEPLADPRMPSTDPSEVDAVLAGFVGTIDQVPSTVSAVKVGGRRAYAIARTGQAVDLPARRVRIDRLHRTSPLRQAVAGCLDVDIEVSCSAGTYVRALARDAGAELGCGAHLEALRRTAVGPFDIARAVALEDIAEEPALSLGAAAAAVLPTVRLSHGDAVRAASGQRLVSAEGLGDGPVALLDDEGGLVAVAVDDGGRWRYRAVFRGQ